MVVDHISFEVYRGEIFGITGNDSCGKSTIAGMLVGAIKPNGGVITLNEQRLRYGDIPFRREHIRLAKLSTIDEFDLDITVYEFLDLTLDIVGIDSEFRDELINYALESLNSQPSLLNKALLKLNRQEKAIVALAHALILRPDILIIDDLFATIDLSFKGVLINIILKLQQQKLTVVLITSDLGILKHIADRVMILQDGVIEDMGNTKEVLTNSHSDFVKLLVRSYFGNNLTSKDWHITHNYPLL